MPVSVSERNNLTANSKNKGFTLFELIVVIIIIGILATLGFTQYARVVEKGRTAEAISVLGTIRIAARAYYLQNGAYPATLGELAVNAPEACTTTHYFYYSVVTWAPCECPGAAANASAVAHRCTGGGKTPDAAVECSVVICFDSGSIWTGPQCGVWVPCR